MLIFFMHKDTAKKKKKKKKQTPLNYNETFESIWPKIIYL